MWKFSKIITSKSKNYIVKENISGYLRTRVVLVSTKHWVLTRVCIRVSAILLVDYQSSHMMDENHISGLWFDNN
jgi:hypothetical protein